MVKFTKFGPEGIGIVLPSRSREGRASRSTNATCVFYQDRNNYVVFRLKGGSLASGSRGNRWQVLLYRSATDRFSVRLKNAPGTILATVTSSAGATGTATDVNADATIGPLVSMAVVGTIRSTTDFSSDINDYCRFTGGS